MKTAPFSHATAEWYVKFKQDFTKTQTRIISQSRTARQHPLFAHTKSVNSCHVCPSAKITSVLKIIQTFVPHRNNSPLTPTGNKSKIEGKCNSCHISSAGAKQSTLTKSKVCSRKYNETHSISLIPQMALTVKHYSWLALSAYDWWKNILFLPEGI